jgi:hypothetical protein
VRSPASHWVVWSADMIFQGNHQYEARRPKRAASQQCRLAIRGWGPLDFAKLSFKLPGIGYRCQARSSDTQVGGGSAIHRRFPLNEGSECLERLAVIRPLEDDHGVRKVDASRWREMRFRLLRIVAAHNNDLNRRGKVTMQPREKVGNGSRRLFHYSGKTPQHFFCLHFIFTLVCQYGQPE